MLQRIKCKLAYRLAHFLYYRIASKLPNSYHSRGSMPQKLRAWCGRFLLDFCGSNVNIERNVDLRGSGICLGDNSGFGEGSIIGDNTIVGNDVMIGRQLITIARNHNIDDLTVPMNRQGFGPRGKILIDDDVWIGDRVMIVGNVRIHSHSVIGAGAVVTRDVPEYAIVGGVPARVIRYRNQTGE